jgi:AraC-like DNA-binding protein
MSLTLDWLHLVILLGAVQGVFLAVALASKKRNRTANGLLAATMLAFSIQMAASVYYAAGLDERYPHLFGVPYPMPFLYGPLIYLYSVAAADSRFRLGWRHALHFAPFLALVVAGLPIYMMSGEEKIALYRHLVSGGRPPLLLVIADPLKFVSGIAYTVVTLMFLRRHRERVKDSYSSTEKVNLRWLVWLGSAAAGIWIMATVFSLLESTGMARVERSDDFVSLALAIMAYSIGYRGLRQPEVFRYETAEYPVQRPSTAGTPPGDPVVGATTDADAGRYERSGLTPAEARRLKEKLLAVMDGQRPWKQSELTLADLAALLDTTPHKLSEVLNSEIGETFYDFVNGYRVREVQRRIAAGEARALKILSLALDAGFASKSTFNQVFKKHTSQTPSDFRQTVEA